MPHVIEIETPRLKLRQWRESDREPFAAMNADTAVMEFFESPQSRAASDASINAWQAQFATRGLIDKAAMHCYSAIHGSRPPRPRQGIPRRRLHH